MTSRKSSGNDIKIETFGIPVLKSYIDLLIVHVSAPASAADDLRNIEKVKNILAWECGRHFTIYPPPKLQLSRFYSENQY